MREEREGRGREGGRKGGREGGKEGGKERGRESISEVNINIRNNHLWTNHLLRRPATLGSYCVRPNIHSALHAPLLGYSLHP